MNKLEVNKVLLKQAEDQRDVLLQEQQDMVEEIRMIDQDLEELDGKVEHHQKVIKGLEAEDAQ